MAIFVYCFECVSDCKVKGKKYIGSTNNLKRRYQQHISELKEGKHYNKSLMKWFSKKNIQFRFYILEKVENPKDRYIREQYYINKYINNCFNMKDISGNYLKKNKQKNKKEKIDIIDTKIILTPQFKHYAKEVDAKTGKFIKWVKKPKKYSTKCIPK